jgi:hypothetical protein
MRRKVFAVRLDDVSRYLSHFYDFHGNASNQSLQRRAGSRLSCIRCLSVPPSLSSIVLVIIVRTAHATLSPSPMVAGYAIDFARRIALVLPIVVHALVSEVALPAEFP